MKFILSSINIFFIGYVLSVSALADTINWQSWNENAFQSAREQNKLILLDVGTEWCSACNKMQHETYTDTTVQAFVNKNYIAIHVDAEAEPDIG